MWLMLSDCYLSIVAKDCRPEELMVRARRNGDIEKCFPAAKVTRSTKGDYLYRAVISRNEIAGAVAAAIQDIDYPNFKGNVEDDALHGAYLKVWSVMATLQEPPPYSGLSTGTPPAAAGAT